jgi:hypothetical protein
LHATPSVTPGIVVEPSASSVLPPRKTCCASSNTTATLRALTQVFGPAQTWFA